MANFTTNYNLQKPFPSEKVDVNVINQNMDVIDTNLKDIADKVDSNSNLKQVVENHINDTMDFSLTNSGSIFAFKTGHVFSQTENFLDNGTITPDFSIGNNGSPWAKVGKNIV